MTAKNQTLLDNLQAHFADKAQSLSLTLNEVTLQVAAENLLSVAQALRDEFKFEQLMDVCGIDYLEYGQADWETKRSSAGFSRAVNKAAHQEEATKHPERFAVVYHLLSISQNLRLRLRVYAAGNPPSVDSVINFWNSANWFEREAFDLYGIVFNGHPDLRRLLTDYGFVGHPFRKDFPLTGEVEMRYDPDKGRVVYEPVSIEARVLVPRVIRHDGRYNSDTKAGAKE